MNDKPTPETDDLARGNHVVPTEFAQDLERERDELKKIVEHRILAGAEIHDKANSLIKQNDKIKAECEHLRKQLLAATSALRQIHLEVGDWIRSTIIVEE